MTYMPLTHMPHDTHKTHDTHEAFIINYADYNTQLADLRSFCEVLSARRVLEHETLQKKLRVEEEQRDTSLLQRKKP